MQAAESTLAAEFPDWHILSCFDVFHLEERRASAPPDHLDDCLAKLANCFKVRLPDLKKQYAALLPIATQLYVLHGKLRCNKGAGPVGLVIAELCLRPGTFLVGLIY